MKYRRFFRDILQALCIFFKEHLFSRTTFSACFYSLYTYNTKKYRIVSFVIYFANTEITEKAFRNNASQYIQITTKFKVTSFDEFLLKDLIVLNLANKS